MRADQIAPDYAIKQASIAARIAHERRRKGWDVAASVGIGIHKREDLLFIGHTVEEIQIALDMGLICEIDGEYFEPWACIDNITVFAGTNMEDEIPRPLAFHRNILNHTENNNSHTFGSGNNSNQTTGETNMHYERAFPSTYLKVSDLDGQDLTLTIRHIAIESVGQGAQAEDKPVIYFSDADKGLVLNKTNAGVIAQAAGSNDMDDWIGKKITLYEGETTFNGKVVQCIRVRAKSPVPQTQRPAATRPQATQQRQHQPTAIKRGNAAPPEPPPQDIEPDDLDAF